MAKESTLIAHTLASRTNHIRHNHCKEYAPFYMNWRAKDKELDRITYPVLTG